MMSRVTGCVSYSRHRDLRSELCQNYKLTNFSGCKQLWNTKIIPGESVAKLGHRQCSEPLPERPEREISEKRLPEVEDYTFRTTTNGPITRHLAMLRVQTRSDQQLQTTVQPSRKPNSVKEAAGTQENSICGKFVTSSF